MILIGAVLFAYLLGSLSSAILTCRLLGLKDPRSQGSGNPGATNVLRMGGKKAAFITLLGDVLKGTFAVWIAKVCGLPPLGVSLVALAVLIGHLYPVFFYFKGGKGVATFLGCLIALYWLLGLMAALTWLVVALLFRYSSLAAIIMALLAPCYTYYFFSDEKTYTIVVGVMSVLLLLRHSQNIQKLWAGTERKIGKS